MSKRKVFYFGLEPLKERYTYQLSNYWMPKTFEEFDLDYINLQGEYDKNEIRVGSVLDACGRGVYSMKQCSLMLEMISKGEVKDNDIIMLQDFWTPGIESVFYALDLYGIKVKLYSMLHAQSVDEYDFTYPMRHWMRDFELGLDKRHSGIFVGSTIHRDQLKQAGFKSPIHVCSLPFHTKNTWEDYLSKYKDKKIIREDKIVFTSRLDKEKNPLFMLAVADTFLKEHPTYKFVITTSATDIKSSQDGIVKILKEYAAKTERLVIKVNLTKEEYYHELRTAKIQFNTSLQDYVSWTLIESTFFGCDVVYPNFRSFPEIIDSDRLYKPFCVDSAVDLLKKCILAKRKHYQIAEISDMGRRMEGLIMKNDITEEYNIWHEYELVNNMIEKERELSYAAANLNGI
jgi:glycosyltransferase involved in cell wall biosynthesis